MTKRYFPIKTATACQLKWAWSTLYLNTGVTRSCHRTATTVLTSENFNNFHNTTVKIQDRKDMLEGKWPEKNCKYCQDIELAGGISDRIRMSAIPDLSPEELYTDSQETQVDPTILEVYFNNVCNLGCLYCCDSLSSIIEAENKKFGPFEKGGVKLIPVSGYYKDLVPYFWQWIETGFSKIKRLHCAGGEPFYQKDFFKLLDFVEHHPNSDCEFNIITNLMVAPELFQNTIDRFKKMLISRRLKRVDITCSIDCWGAEQEYVRWGLKLDVWEQNFQYLLEQKWLTLNINQCIIPLTIKTMPKLIEKLQEWRKHRSVGHYFSGAYPVEDYFRLDVLGENVFKQDIELILNLMPKQSEQDLQAYSYMQGILNQIRGTELNVDRVRDMIIFLDEKDRRRNTNWRAVFPWLAEIEQNVV